MMTIIQPTPRDLINYSDEKVRVLRKELTRYHQTPEDPLHRRIRSLRAFCSEQSGIDWVLDTVSAKNRGYIVKTGRFYNDDLAGFQEIEESHLAYLCAEFVNVENHEVDRDRYFLTFDFNRGVGRIDYLLLVKHTTPTHITRFKIAREPREYSVFWNHYPLKEEEYKMGRILSIKNSKVDPTSTLTPREAYSAVEYFFEDVLGGEK